MWLIREETKISKTTMSMYQCIFVYFHYWHCLNSSQNNYPFPYKIDIEVAGSDQSSIDAIRSVGGSVTIVYYDRVNLRAHLKPYKFEVLPKTVGYEWRENT